MKDVTAPAVFDLDHAMATWRSRLLEGQSCQSSDADELGGHLLDELDRLRSLGLSTEEAFWVAARRLGDPTALSAEFAKADPLRPWRTQLIWMASGFVAIALLNTLTNLMRSAVWAFAVYFGLGGSAVAVVSLIITCVIPLFIVLIFMRSAASVRVRNANISPLPRSRLAKLTAAAPAYYLVLILAVYVPLIVAHFGGYHFSFRITEVYGKMEGLAMNIEMAWSFIFPVFLTLLVLRGRRVLARAASAE